MDWRLGKRTLLQAYILLAVGACVPTLVLSGMHQFNHISWQSDDSNVLLEVSQQHLMEMICLVHVRNRMRNNSECSMVVRCAGLELNEVLTFPDMFCCVLKCPVVSWYVLMCPDKSWYVMICHHVSWCAMVCPVVSWYVLLWVYEVQRELKTCLHITIKQ